MSSDFWRNGIKYLLYCAQCGNDKCWQQNKREKILYYGHLKKYIYKIQCNHYFKFQTGIERIFLNLIKRICLKLKANITITDRNIPFKIRDKDINY